MIDPHKCLLSYAEDYALPKAQATIMIGDIGELILELRAEDKHGDLHHGRRVLADREVMLAASTSDMIKTACHLLATDVFKAVQGADKR